jgi:hypothetical protein
MDEQLLRNFNETRQMYKVPLLLHVFLTGFVLRPTLLIVRHIDTISSGGVQPRSNPRQKHAGIRVDKLATQTQVR